MGSKINFGKLVRVYRYMVVYALVIAVGSYVYKRFVLDTDAIKTLVPEIYAILMSCIVLMIGWIKSWDNLGHPDEENMVNYRIHLFGFVLVVVIGLGLKFYYDNMFIQLGDLPYPYLSSGLISFGFLIYYVSLVRQGIKFNETKLSGTDKEYRHHVMKMIGYIFAVAFIYIMVVVFSGALLGYTRQGVNQSMTCIFMIGLIFAAHYLVCSIYAKISYHDSKHISEVDVQPMISKNLFMLFGIAAVYKIFTAVSAYMILRMQDLFHIRYNRIYDLFNMYHWTQYFEINFWILMGVIGYLYYVALSQKISNPKIKTILKIMMFLFPLYSITQGFMTLFSTDISNQLGIIRYLLFVSGMNTWSFITVFSGLFAGVFIYFVMRSEKLPSRTIFLAHTFILFVGKMVVMIPIKFNEGSANPSLTTGLFNIGFSIVTASIMMLHLYKLNHQKSNRKERVLLGGINYERIRQ